MKRRGLVVYVMSILLLAPSFCFAGDAVPYNTCGSFPYGTVCLSYGNSICPDRFAETVPNPCNNGNGWCLAATLDFYPPDGYGWDFVAIPCFACASGCTGSGGTCVHTTGVCECPAGQVLVNGQCACLGGQVKVSGVCQCPSGYVLNPDIGKCQKSSDTESYRSGTRFTEHFGLQQHMRFYGRGGYEKKQ